MRASDAEREAVVEQLRVASVEGRLTLVELTDRTEAAYTATTHAELALLTQDLPAGTAPPPPPPPRPPRDPRAGSGGGSSASWATPNGAVPGASSRSSARSR
ncbi:DUF1707 domain-containing protein [Nonomuraea antimicrobica]